MALTSGLPNAAEFAAAISPQSSASGPDIDGVYRRFEEKYGGLGLPIKHFVTRPLIRRIYEGAINFKGAGGDELQDAWSLHQSVNNSASALPFNTDPQGALTGMALMLEYGIRAPVPVEIDEAQRSEVLDRAFPAIPEREEVRARDLSRGEVGVSIGLALGRALRGESLPSAFRDLGAPIARAQARKDEAFETEIANLQQGASRAMQELAILSADTNADRQVYAQRLAEFNTNLREAARLGQNQEQFTQNYALNNMQAQGAFEQGEFAMLSTLINTLEPEERKQVFESISKNLKSENAKAFAAALVSRGPKLTIEDKTKAKQLEILGQTYDLKQLAKIAGGHTNTLLNAQVKAIDLGNFADTLKVLSAFYDYNLKLQYGEPEIKAALAISAAQVTALRSRAASEAMDRFMKAAAFIGTDLEKTQQREKMEMQFRERGTIQALITSHGQLTSRMNSEQKLQAKAYADTRLYQEKIIASEAVGRDYIVIDGDEISLDDAKSRRDELSDRIAGSEIIAGGYFGTPISGEIGSGTGLMGIVDDLLLLGVEFDAAGNPVLPEVLRVGLTAAPKGIQDLIRGSEGAFKAILEQGISKGGVLDTSLGAFGASGQSIFGGR